MWAAMTKLLIIWLSVGKSLITLSLERLSLKLFHYQLKLFQSSTIGGKDPGS
jgi:hypothetical protein